MSAGASNKPTRKRLAIATIGLCTAGLAPLVTGLVGIWQFLARGYFISKTGEPVGGLLAVVASGMFILAGLGMIAYAIADYSRKSRSSD